MRVGVLGPLEVTVDDAAVEVRGPLPRRLLALLAASAGATVSVEQLIDGLWPDNPPPGARQTLQSHVARLRRAIGHEAVVAKASGYLLQVSADDVDALAFPLRVKTARASDPQQRPQRLVEALELWRGPAYGEFLDAPVLAAEAARLEELRLDVVQERWEGELALPGAKAPVAELEALVRNHRTREGLWAALMHALYLSDRQADALATFQRARRVLVEELGIEPGPGLRAMEARVLAHDPALRPTEGPVPVPAEVQPQAPRSRQRRSVVVLAVELPVADDDPEDAATSSAVMATAVSDVVAEHGGMLLPPRADVLLAVFGAVVAHEDDAQRAVAAARALVRGLPTDCPVRCGIAAGEVVVSLSGDAVEVTGPALRMADALRAASQPGEIVVDAAARALLGPGAETSPTTGGEHSSVGGTSSGPAHPAYNAPFVGRESDLALLEAVCGRALDEEDVQAVLVVGEPGLGKSRLLAELRERQAVSGLPFRWLVGRCRPYGDTTALGPVSDLVRADLGLDVVESEQVTARLGTAHPRLRPEARRQLGELLTAGATTTPEGGLPPLLRAWLADVASQAPLVVLLEDLHWANPALLDLLESVLEGLHSVPVVVLMTTRPELLDRRTGWGAGASTLRLGPLPDAFIAELLVDAGERRADLVRRSGGVPLYAEQLLSWAELEHAEAAAPPTLRALLHARIDALPEEARHVLELAAVAGPVVWSDEIAGLHELAGGSSIDVDAALGTLVRRHFLRRLPTSRRPGEVELSFWHDLVRETAEARLPRGLRAGRHLDVARWWQGRDDAPPGRVDEAAVAAYDLAARAGDDDLQRQARPLACAAALHAGRTLQGVDTATALRQLQRALDLCDGDQLRPVIHFWLGAALHDDRQFGRAADLLADAVATLRARGDLLAVDALLFLASASFAAGRPLSPVAAAAEALAEELPPSRAAVRTLAALAMMHLIQQTDASLREALRLCDQAITMAEEHRCGGDALARVIRGRARLGLGQGDGLLELEGSLDDVLHEESGTIAIGVRQWLAGALHHWRGPAAEFQARRALEALAHERGLGFIVSMGVAEDVRVLCELSRYDEALALSEEVPDQAEAQPRWIAVQRALALLDLGRLDDLTVQRVVETPPADSDDLRHLLGQALVVASAALERGAEDVAIATLRTLGDAQRFVPRDGAVELLPRLARTCIRARCPELVEKLHAIDAVSTPLRQAIARTVQGLQHVGAQESGPARASLTEAARLWTSMGFVAEAAAVEEDLRRLDSTLGARRT